MKFIKSLILYILVIGAIIYGINVYISYSAESLDSQSEILSLEEEKNSNKEIQTEESVELERVEHQKEEVNEKNSNINYNYLLKTVSLNCEKGEEIKKILERISEENDINFRFPKSNNELGKIDLTMNIESITVEEVLEILIGNENYFWYNREGNTIVVMRKG
ncbi:MAG: hypothetical protein ACQESP_04215 [Candidatus Muiribacteriota bacterium]